MKELLYFGQMLRQLRTDMGISLHQFARLTNYSPGYLSRIENGHRAPHAKLARRCDEILGADGALASLVSATSAVKHRPLTMPAQLPPDTACFSGRSDPIAKLNALLADRDRAHAVKVAAVSGTPGVGKSVLAVHWAHQVADQFSDGNLYVDLRGFSPGAVSISPGEAIRSFLGAFGVPPARVPARTDAQVGLYRSLLAGKRVLLLIDNARDADQVRPLLPGSPGCFVIVTSRSALTALTAAVGALTITLDLFSADESRKMLKCQLGPDRVESQPQAADELIELCARLPLALAVAASRAATNPGTALADFTAELRRARSRLDALDIADPITNVRAIFASSYQHLTRHAKRMFRLLGLHPGQHFSAMAAASLAGVPRLQAEEALTDLTHAHLLTEDVPGRYTFHDLLRVYAQELAERTENHAEQRAAVHRMLDHYLHTTFAATLRWDQSALEPPVLDAPLPGVSQIDVGDHHGALAWFRSECPVLISMVNYAAAQGFDTHTWQLAWSLTRFLDRQGHWEDCISIQRAALSASRRLGNGSALASANLYAGRAYTRKGRHADAYDHHQRALRLCQECGDLSGQAMTHLNICLMWERQGEYKTALNHAEQAFSLYKALGHQAGQANALNDIGSLQSELGDYREALSSCRQALKLSLESGDRFCQACACDSLGYAHYHLGDASSALRCFLQALKMFREIGDRFNETEVLDHLGEVHSSLGHTDAARAAWQHAAAILHELHHPGISRMHAKLLAVRDAMPAPDQMAID